MTSIYLFNELDFENLNWYVVYLSNRKFENDLFSLKIYFENVDEYKKHKFYICF